MVKLKLSVRKLLKPEQKPGTIIVTSDNIPVEVRLTVVADSQEHAEKVFAVLSKAAEELK